MRENLRKREEKRRQALEARLAETRLDFDRIVEHLALEGITDTETFFKILGDVQRMSPLPLDVVEMETIHSA